MFPGEGVNMAQKSSTLLISLINNTDNLGLKSIHSSLLARGHDSHILFYTSEDLSYIPTVAHFISEQRFGIVGISVMSHVAEAHKLPN